MYCLFPNQAKLDRTSVKFQTKVHFVRVTVFDGQKNSGLYLVTDSIFCLSRLLALLRFTRDRSAFLNLMLPGLFYEVFSVGVLTVGLPISQFLN